jgi:hypothetical protein
MIMVASLVQIADGLWHAEKDIGFGWYNGMFVVRLATGGLLLHSATRLGEQMLEAIAALGEVEVLFAPNHFHHLGVPSYRARFPKSIVVASDGARPRLEKKGHAPISSLAEAERRLPAGARFLVPEGLKNGEAWLSLEVEGRRTWIVCDAFFHENRPLRGVRGWILKRLSIAPGISIGDTFLWVGVSDRRAYRAWLERTLEAERPARILVSHGTPYEVREGTELRDLIARRLRV